MKETFPDSQRLIQYYIQSSFSVADLVNPQEV